MNPELSDINSILSACDAMIEDINKNGILKAVDSNYEQYKTKISHFLKAKDLARPDYGPHAALDALYFSGNRYTVNISEAKTIREIIIELKHDLFPDSFEKIFISHREKDKEQVEQFIELLHAIGIPRPTTRNNNKVIFCTSHPAAYIDNGKKNLDEIKSQLNSSDHIYYILWYSDHYFESQACLNEAGAIWAMNKKYQEILTPDFDHTKIQGLLDKQPVWFRANDKYRLNTFKTQLESMFCLDPIEQNAWEIVRDRYIYNIEKKATS